MKDKGVEKMHRDGNAYWKRVGWYRYACSACGHEQAHIKSAKECPECHAIMNERRKK